MKRREDPRLLTGSGRYADDFSLPGQAYAYVLRSPHAHARIAGIDVTAALAVPGVLAVLTGADAAGDGIGPIPHSPVRANPHEVPLKSRDASPFFLAPYPVLASDAARYVANRSHLSSPTRRRRRWTRPSNGDTERVQAGGGSASARSMRLGSWVVALASDQIVEKGRCIAAALLEAAEADIDFLRGRFVVTGTDRSVGLFEVAAAALGDGYPLLIRVLDRREPYHSCVSAMPERPGRNPVAVPA